MTMTTITTGYGAERLPMDCWIERSVGKAYYPWGERVNPNTLNLSRVIMEITVIPPSMALPSEIKISPETIVSMDIAGGILRPEEDAHIMKSVATLVMLNNRMP